MYTGWRVKAARSEDPDAFPTVILRSLCQWSSMFPGGRNQLLRGFSTLELIVMSR